MRDARTVVYSCLLPVSGEPSGFEQGWEADEILGATEVDNQILFLIKW